MKILVWIMVDSLGDSGEMTVKQVAEGYGLPVTIETNPDSEDCEHKPSEGNVTCPHCHGAGEVKEDFLTDEHVSDVFRDYAELFKVWSYNSVESWDDWGDHVYINTSWSRRGCTDYESLNLPKAYFTRDVEKRKALMKEEWTKVQAQIAAEAEAKKAAELAAARATVKRLEEENGSAH